MPDLLAGPDGRHDALPVAFDGRRAGPPSAWVATVWALVVGFAVATWTAAGAGVAALVVDGGPWDGVAGTAVGVAVVTVAVVVVAAVTVAAVGGTAPTGGARSPRGRH